MIGPAVRLAVVVSSNDGKAGDERLLYSDSDAHRVRDVLVELGGFAAADVWEVPEATIDGVTGALAAAVLRASALHAEGRPVALLVYYTGHAGADGLHLGDEVLALSSLKTAARVVPADERVFVVDACQAGQILRSKGAVRVDVRDAPAEFVPPPDEAWIASAGAEEQAFEVDRRRGALFTHFFVSGARGAADGDADGEVTLSELYGFVHARTAETAADLGYVQEPRWAGALGAFVVSRPGAAGAGIDAIGPVAEPLLVVDERSAAVVAEIPRGAGGRLAVPEGRYQLVALGGGARVTVATVDVPAEGYAPIGRADLATVRGVRTKGGLVDLHPWSLALGYALSTGATPGRVDGHGAFVQLRQAVGRGHELALGAELASVPIRTSWVAGVDTALSLGLGWGLDLVPGSWRVGPTADAAPGLVRQRVARTPDPVWGAWYGADAAEQVVTAATFRAHAGVAATVPFARDLGLVIAAGAGPAFTAAGPSVPDLRLRVGIEVAP